MPAGGIASLTDGEYRKPIVEGSAMELVIRLADMAFGDLDGDGDIDFADYQILEANFYSHNIYFSLLDLGADPAWS